MSTRKTAKPVLGPAPDRERPPQATAGQTADSRRAAADIAPTRTRRHPPDATPMRGVVRGHVVTAVGVLRARLADPWTVDELAREVNLSRSQLVRAFDATVGMSPMTYLRQMRVDRMARLLVCTDLSVADAARSVGWSDAFYASRSFHAHYGLSPTEYRRQQSAPSVD